jgi:hypothetical protein
LKFCIQGNFYCRERGVVHIFGKTAYFHFSFLGSKMPWRALNFDTVLFAKLPECLKVVELVFEWVGNDDSGPED